MCVSSIRREFPAFAKRGDANVASLFVSYKVYELKNLVVAQEYRGKGYARKLVEALAKELSPQWKRLRVGTGAPLQTFYEKLGFRYTHTRKDFFVKNYSEPIIDESVLLIDMLCFSMDLLTD